MTVDGNLLTLPSGVWGSWLPIVEELRAQLVAVHADYRIGFLSSNILSIARTDGHAFALTFPDTPLLADMLGYDRAGHPAASRQDAVHPPDHAWFPPHQAANQDRFAVNQGEAFAGARAKDGSVSGTATGPEIYERQFTFEHVPARLVFREAAYYVTPGPPEVDYDTPRCFETLIKSSRTVYAGTAGQPSPKGFYYVPDMRPYRFATDNPTVDAQPTFPVTVNSGGIRFDMPGAPAATPDRYVFGHCPPDGAAVPSASVPRAREYYECRVEFCTAPAPLWSAP